MQSKPETKRICINLSALTRVEYSEVIEVPAHFDEDDLAEIVDARYKIVDGGEFQDDPDYWERGSCYASEVDQDYPPPSLKVSVTDDGQLIYEETSQ